MFYPCLTINCYLCIYYEMLWKTMRSHIFQFFLPTLVIYSFNSEIHVVAHSIDGLQTILLANGNVLHFRNENPPGLHVRFLRKCPWHRSKYLLHTYVRSISRNHRFALFAKNFQSEKVLHAIYDCHWPGSGDKQIMMDVLSLLSQKPMKFRSYNYFLLTMEMFLKVIDDCKIEHWLFSL